MREITLRQILRCFQALDAVGGEAPRGVNNLVPAAVVHADVGLKALIVRGNFVCAGNERAQLRTDGPELAENFQADMVALHLVDGLMQVFFEQGHDCLHLVRRALPVFRGKRIDSQIFDAEILAAGRNAAECLRAGRVAHFARQSALFRPAAVAVHNDGDVPRERVVVFHDKSLSRQKPPSGGF